MNINLKLTLTTAFSLLFFNNVYAVSDDAHACNKAYDLGDYKAAANSATMALKVNSSDREALICQGRVASDLGDLNLALSSFKAADILSNHPLDKAVIALITGHTYKNAKQYDQATANYQLSLKQADLARHKPMARSSHIGIGNVQFETKQYQAALDTYFIAHKLDANDNDRGQSYEKIAETYHMLNQHDLALEYQVKTYFMHEKAGTLDQFAHSSIILGQYYTVVKNYPKAEVTLNKIIKFANEQGGAYYEAQGLYILAQVKAATGDMQTAKTLVAQARAIAKSANDADLDAEITRETESFIK
jgi:tetratricopeptide (TPR) repeat protein